MDFKTFKNKFKEGANNPVTIQLSKIFFLFWTVFGFAAGSIQSYLLGSWGLSIALIAFSGLQSISFILEIKAYKSLKETIKAFKDMSNNKEMEELI